jgi:hypothetical protein
MTESLIIAIAVFGAAMLAAHARGEEILVEFSGQTFDRWVFRPDTGFGPGRWQSKGQGLRAVMPAGLPDRNAMPGQPRGAGSAG